MIQEAGSEPGAESQEPAVSIEDMTKVVEGRWGSREIEITGVTLGGESGEAAHIFQSGERVSIHLTVRAHEPNDDFVFGIGLYSADGITCYGTNTHLEDYKAEEIRGEGEVVLNIESLDLVEGTYKLDVAVHKRDGYPYDYHRLLYTFRVKSRTKEVGIYRPRHTWTFSPTIKCLDSRSTADMRKGHVTRRGGGVCRASAALGQGSGVHQRRVRSPAPRPCSLPARLPGVKGTR